MRLDQDKDQGLAQCQQVAPIRAALIKSRATQGLKYLRKLTESPHRSELTLRAMT
jgi:hypothetical protein